MWPVKANVIIVSKSSLSLTWWMLLFNSLEFLGNICLEMRWLSYPMVITTLDASFMGNQECLVVMVCLCTGGHCFIYKDGRLGHNNCMAQLQASIWKRCTGLSGLPACCTCAIAKSTLAESRQDDRLSQSASHIRVMPDVRFDGTGLF